MKLELTMEEVSGVIIALKKFPMEQVEPLVNKIIQQLQEQQSQSEQN
jgi:hypothetical protein